MQAVRLPAEGLTLGELLALQLTAHSADVHSIGSDAGNQLHIEVSMKVRVRFRVKGPGSHAAAGRVTSVCSCLQAAAWRWRAVSAAHAGAARTLNPKPYRTLRWGVWPACLGRTAHPRLPAAASN